MHHKRRVLARLKKARKEKINRLVERLRNQIKTEDIYLDKCKEYKEKPNFINSVQISFAPLDVSAKTINGEVFLNEKLLNEDFDTQARYILHESIHCLQQKYGKVKGKVDKEDYLDDENEQEAFQAQIEYMQDHESPEEVQTYIEQLLDHHDIEGEEREEKKEILLDE